MYNLFCNFVQIDFAIIGYNNSVGNWTYYNPSAVQTWLGLGSLAYKSPTGSAAGKVLTATDGNGNSTWQTPGYSSGEYTVSYSNLSAGILSMSTNHAYYTKIGNVVHVNVAVSFSCDAGTYSFDLTLPVSSSVSSSGAGSFTVPYMVVGSSISTFSTTATVGFQTSQNIAGAACNITFDYVVSN